MLEPQAILFRCLADNARRDSGNIEKAVEDHFRLSIDINPWFNTRDPEVRKKFFAAIVDGVRAELEGRISPDYLDPTPETSGSRICEACFRYLKPRAFSGCGLKHSP